MTTPDIPRTPDDAHDMDQQNTSPATSSSPSGPATASGPGAASGSGAASGAGPGASPGAGSGSGHGPGSGSGSSPAEGTGSLSLDEPLVRDSADELALRAMMHDAVSGLHGSPDALDHLRRAIPVRRQRRRQAVIGAAAAVLLVGLAVPALLRVSSTGGGASAAPAGAASPQTTLPSAGHAQPSGGPSGQAASGVGAGPRQHPPAGSGGPGRPSATVSATGTASPAPDCSAGQLGSGTSQAAAAGGDGTVYGWFRVANVSDDTCTVPGDGTVQVQAAGAADPARIRVVAHTAGDAAPALPSSASDGPVVLKPGQDYEVAFAWVPEAGGDGGCPAVTTPPDSPTPTATASDTTGGGSGVDAAGTSVHGADATQDDGGTSADPPQAGSVTLTHTPAAGGPEVTSPVIQDACAGTVYTTAPIPDPSGDSGTDGSGSGGSGS